MQPDLTKWTRIVVVFGLVLGLAMPASAQTVSGEAFGAFVQTPTASQDKSPLAALPSVDAGEGEMAEASAGALSVPGTLSSRFLESVTSAARAADGASAQSVATLADVSVLDGLVRADRVIAVATSSRDDDGTITRNGNGSGFEGLVVNGVPIVEDGQVPPDTRIDLPGVGYVILNEQTLDSGRITVNMIHVVLQDALTGARVGDIIVGSATSTVD